MHGKKLRISARLDRSKIYGFRPCRTSDDYTCWFLYRKILAELADGNYAVFSSRDDYLVDTGAVVESHERQRENWYPVYLGEQLILSPHTRRGACRRDKRRTKRMSGTLAAKYF
ncbi:hypothetical protein SDC9_205426 [bioreactor metagenome]|uniref:Uncharacterized protein n=1 Tax=bioreactor metagenome TaxID=1076179 RepID=A0A645J3P5_9ZZZZ